MCRQSQNIRWCRCRLHLMGRWYPTLIRKWRGATTNALRTRKVLQWFQTKCQCHKNKTKCIIFNKTGRIIHRIFHYKGILLENVRSYKYLGSMLTPSGSITRGLEDLRDRAGKALVKIRRGMGKLINKSIRDTINIFDYMVKPILLYASDFRGCQTTSKQSNWQTSIQPVDKYLGFKRIQPQWGCF